MQAAAHIAEPGALAQVPGSVGFSAANKKGRRRTMTEAKEALRAVSLARRQKVGDPLSQQQIEIGQATPAKVVVPANVLTQLLEMLMHKAGLVPLRLLLTVRECKLRKRKA